MSPCLQGAIPPNLMPVFSQSETLCKSFPWHKEVKHYRIFRSVPVDHFKCFRFHMSKYKHASMSVMITLPHFIPHPLRSAAEASLLSCCHTFTELSTNHTSPTIPKLIRFKSGCSAFILLLGNIRSCY